MKKLILLGILLCSNFILIGQNADSILVFEDKNEILNIGKQVYFLEDKEGKLTIEDIQKTPYQKLFKKSDREVFEFGLSQSWIWVRIPAIIPSNVLVQISEPNIKDIELYTYHQNHYNKQVIGNNRNIFTKEYILHLPTFSLTDSQKATYIRLKYNGIAFRIMVATKSAFKQIWIYRFIAFFIFMGLVLFISIYNFLFYIFNRHTTNNLLYSIYVFILLLTSLGISGYIFYFTDQIDGISYIILTASFAQSMMVVYSIYFFDVKQSLLKVAVFLSLFPFSAVLLLWFESATIDLIMLQINGLITSLWGIVVGILHRKKQGFAIFYVYGYVLFFAFIFLELLLINIGIHSVMPLSYYDMGVLMEVCFLAFALLKTNSEKQKELERKQQKSQTELLEKTLENEKLVREQNTILEQKVLEKTLDLQMAYEELQVTNEELQQSQEEILVQRDMVVEQNGILEAYRYKISQSIESALLIQKAILPTQDKLNLLLKEYFVLYRPKDIVSGDFYWANQIHEHKFLIVADCTGHGVSGAFMTMIGSALLDRIICVLNIQEPHLILDRLHEEIQRVLQQKQTGNSDGMDISIVRWEEKNTQILLDFAAAKRPLYVLTERIQKIEGSRKSVGGKSNNKIFEKTSLILPTNTLIYLSTDGYADQNNADRNSFSEKHFAAILNNMTQIPINEQKIILDNILNEHMAGTEQRDDILVIGFRL